MFIIEDLSTVDQPQAKIVTAQVRAKDDDLLNADLRPLEQQNILERSKSM